LIPPLFRAHYHHVNLQFDVHQVVLPHRLYQVTEEFAMSDVNDAFEHLKAGKARYRIVLRSDFEE